MTSSAVIWTVCGASADRPSDVVKMLRLLVAQSTRSPNTVIGPHARAGDRVAGDRGCTGGRAGGVPVQADVAPLSVFADTRRRRVGLRSPGRSAPGRDRPGRQGRRAGAGRGWSRWDR